MCHVPATAPFEMVSTASPCLKQGKGMSLHSFHVTSHPYRNAQGFLPQPASYFYQVEPKCQIVVIQSDILTNEKTSLGCASTESWLSFD